MEGPQNGVQIETPNGNAKKNNVREQGRKTNLNNYLKQVFSLNIVRLKIKTIHKHTLVNLLY